VTFDLDAGILMDSLAASLASLQPYIHALLGLVLAAGILSRGLGMIKWGGR
jgi:hypothetical protein